MKFLKLILPFLLASLLLIACKSNVSTFKSNTSTSVSPTSNQEGDSASPTLSPSPDYKIIKKTFKKNNDIEINYPQITDLNDINRQSKINEILKTDALKVANKKVDVNKKIHIEANYNIKFQNSNLLSIQYSIYEYVEGAAHPNDYFITSNIDLNSGKRLSLKDVVNIDKEFVSKIKGEMKKANSVPLNYLLETYKDDEFIKALNQADMPFESSYYISSYFTKDSFGISFDVPYAIGNHVELELKYKDIIKNLKPNDKIWSGILN